MSLYLVFEHVHQDLASYLEKCPPPGLAKDRIKVWVIICNNKSHGTGFSLVAHCSSKKNVLKILKDSLLMVKYLKKKIKTFLLLKNPKWCVVKWREFKNVAVAKYGHVKEIYRAGRLRWRHVHEKFTLQLQWMANGQDLAIDVLVSLEHKFCTWEKIHHYL